MTTGLQLDTFDQLCLGSQSIHNTGELPRVSPGLAELFFKPIELFDHCYRNNQVIVFKTKKSLRVVQEDIGIKNKSFFHERDTLPGSL